MNESSSIDSADRGEWIAGIFAPVTQDRAAAAAPPAAVDPRHERAVRG